MWNAQGMKKHSEGLADSGENAYRFFGGDVI